MGESGGLVVKPWSMMVGCRLGVGREEASRMKPSTLSGSLLCGDTPVKDQEEEQVCSLGHGEY